MKNPLLGWPLGSWPVFLALLIGGAEFKPWGLTVWGLFLGFTTLAPFVWWYRKSRKKSQ